MSKGYVTQRVLVLYGSQTGTAQDVAYSIATQSRGSHFVTVVSALDAYPPKNLLDEKIALFVCSTTGQGDTPDNMKKFWRFIMRKDLPTNSLPSLKFAVLGLGDSSYAKYNFVAKKLNRRLQQLGGRRLIDIGLADDQHDWGADAAIDPWITEMWSELVKHYPVPEGALNPMSGALSPQRFEIHNTKVIEKGEIMQSSSYSRGHPYFAPVKMNPRVTSADHFQNTISVIFDTSEAKASLSYKPGDVLMVKPSNTEENVNEFLETFSHFQPDDDMVITTRYLSDSVPKVMGSSTTLRKLAREYFDFQSVPRRSFFQMIRHFAEDDLEKIKLEEFSTPEATDDRHNYANRPRRTLLEVLQDFHRTAKNIPLVRLLEIIPEIQPRAFSIASSPSMHKNELHILVAVVKYKTSLRKPRLGLCSTWLSKLIQGAKVPIWIKTGGINFPLCTVLKEAGDEPISSSTPCIMIGPGTGVAPFRSAIHERAYNGEKENILFFGCRNRGGDFYFEDEWKSLIGRKQLTLHTAFSRDQDHKVYVQHIIAQQNEALWDLIRNRSAKIYVAGNSKNMPDAVRDAFLKIFQDLGEMTEKEAVQFYDSLQKNKRYQQETWS